MIENFFAIGDLIVKRLQDTLSIPKANIKVAPNQAWAIANVVDKSVHVIFFDDQPDNQQNAPQFKNGLLSSTQYWLVVVSFKSVANVGVAAQNQAGPIVVDTLKALQGYCLGLDYTELTRQRCQFRNPDAGGYVHIPLMFSTRFVM